MGTRRPILAGIFVGGRSSRMGGRPKGLLPAPGASGETLVERAATMFRSLDVPVVLVGEQPEYGALPYPVIADAVRDLGPLGGLVSLLEAAGDGYAIACACDMPFITPALAARLMNAAPTSALAPLAGEVLQPLFARYDAPSCLPIARRRALEAARGSSGSLQGLLRELGATALPLAPEEERWLDDWDEPNDMLARPDAPPP